MAFKENLLSKIQIQRLSKQVLQSIGPPGTSQKIDKEAARQLLALSPYTQRRERDLELYVAETAGKVLVLDNEFPLYQTSIQDVALRKSPTVKEMLNIRNVIKILNDSDVIISKKEDSVKAIEQESLCQLDLSYTAADIRSLAEEGRFSLELGDSDGVIQTLELFAELLELVSPPAPFALPKHRTWARTQQAGRELEVGPLFLYRPETNRLIGIHAPLQAGDKTDLEWLRQVVTGREAPEEEGVQVFETLKDQVLSPAPV